jgi:hypothetical protein
MHKRAAADLVDSSRSGYLVHDARSYGRDLVITAYIEGLEGDDGRVLMEEHLGTRTAEQSRDIAKLLREARRAPDCSIDRGSSRACERGAKGCTIVHADFARIEAECAASLADAHKCLERARGHLRAIRALTSNGSEAWQAAEQAIAEIDAVLAPAGQVKGGVHG